MGTTAWMIGSNPAIGVCTVDVTGDGNPAETEDVLTAESPLYLYNAGGALDALEQLRDAIRAYANGADLTETLVYLNRDRKVTVEFLTNSMDPVSADIVSFDGAGGEAFQELLGFDGSELNQGEVETLTANNVSPYLWSANKIETPAAPRGELGIPYYDTAVGQSGTRVVVATTNNSGYVNDFHFEKVERGRYWTATQEWGEYRVWWDYVQRRFRRFKLYSGVNELDASTDAATIPSSLNGSNPYMWRVDGNTPITFPMARDLEFYEFLYTVDIPVVVVDEYS